MVGVGLFYTLLSGLYGVVFTDIVQMILLVFTALFVTVHAFAIQPSVDMPAALLALDLEAPSAVAGGLLERSPAEWGPIFEMFGVCVLFWLMRTALEGMGGVGGYTDQRFFAARTEREASLLTLEAIVLSVFRWTMVAGLVVMGYSLLGEGGEAAGQISRDAEQVLPVVLGRMLPAGVKGLVIAGLIAAAMSTFDSTLNAGASCIVKDIYASYVRPEADERALMAVSRWATVGLCAAGVLLAAVVPNINRIWGLITMGIGAGMFVPLFLRWYWPRFNGLGFAAGTAAGIVGALLFDAWLAWPLYHSFPTVIGLAFSFAVAATLLSPPTSEQVLDAFWLQVNPWGLWGRYAARAKERGVVTEAEGMRRVLEKLYDAVALCLSVPFQLCLLLGAMAFVWHDWEKFALFASCATLAGVGLYFFWFKNLKSEAECLADEERFASSITRPR